MAQSDFMGRFQRFGRSALGWWLAAAFPIAFFVLLYANNGQDGWLSRMMDAYPMLWVPVVAVLAGPLVAIWWVRQDDQSETAPPRQLR